MKKSIISLILILSFSHLSLADEAKTGKEIRQERREMRKEMHQKKKDFRREHREEMKQAREECRAKIEATTTEEAKETLRSECRKEAREQREALRENIKNLRREAYTNKLSNLRALLTDSLEKLKALPQAEKDAFKTRITARLDELEDKANEDGNDIAILTIAAIREIITGI